MQAYCVLLEEKLWAEAEAAFTNKQAHWHKNIQNLSSVPFFNFFISAVCACGGINVAVTKFQKSCEHTVSVQLRASDVNVGFENFLQHFCLSHLGQSKCERKQQLITSFLPSFSIASMEHQVLCECCQCSVPNSSDELILVKRRALFGQKYGR